MNEINFLHIADVHFGSKILGLDEKKRSIRYIETQMTLKKTLQDYDAQIVLIAGDLFDGEYDYSTIIFLCKLFSEYPDKRFFIACGNHDYLSSKNIKILAENIPSNVHVFTDTMNCVRLDDIGVKIYGCSFSSPYLYSSLLSGFKADDDGMVNIMLMHGDVDSASKYNPIEISDIALSNLDYIALGHRHNFSGIKKAGKTMYAYPGVPEPHGFDECGACGIIRGTIHDKNIEAFFVPVSSRRYESISIDITDISSDSELIEKINSETDECNIYKINLIGTVNAGITLNFSAYEKLVNSFYCEFADSTHPSADIFVYNGENSLRGKTASILNKCITDNYFENEKTKNEVIKILTELLCKGGND